MPHVRICGGGGKRWGAESRDAAAPAFARRGWHRGLHSLPSPLLLIPTAGKVLTTAGPPGPVHTASSDPPIPQRPNPRRSIGGTAVLREGQQGRCGWGQTIRASSRVGPLRCVGAMTKPSRSCRRPLSTRKAPSFRQLLSGRPMLSRATRVQLERSCADCWRAPARAPRPRAPLRAV
jgi:hypothetical protein